MFQIFDQMDYTGVNERWRDKSKRTDDQRRCDKVGRYFDKLVKETYFA